MTVRLNVALAALICGPWPGDGEAEPAWGAEAIGRRDVFHHPPPVVEFGFRAIFTDE